MLAKRVTCMTRDIPKARWLEVRSRWYPSGLRRLIEALDSWTVDRVIEVAREWWYRDGAEIRGVYPSGLR